jgi:hypothetical protein
VLLILLHSQAWEWQVEKQLSHQHLAVKVIIKANGARSQQREEREGEGRKGKRTEGK